MLPPKSIATLTFLNISYLQPTLLICGQNIPFRLAQNKVSEWLSFSEEPPYQHPGFAGSCLFQTPVKVVSKLPSTS